MVRTAALIFLALASCGSPSAEQDSSNLFKPISNFDFAGAIPADMTPTTLVSSAKLRCAGRQICGVYAWRDANSVASAVPLLERETASLSFRYEINRTTGFEQTLFDCKSFDRPKSECMGN